MDCTWAK